MDPIKLFLYTTIMSGIAHFTIFMTAYDINLRYAGMNYQFKTIKREDIMPFRFLYAFPKRYDPQTSPFLLTIDGEKWALLHYIIDVPLCFACYYWLEAIPFISEKDRLWIVWVTSETIFALLSFWMHRASNTVIQLSRTKFVSPADLEQHIKSKLKSAKKSFSEQQYCSEIVKEMRRKRFWIYEEWAIIVTTENRTKVILKKIIATRTSYRYYDGAVIELIDRFTSISGRENTSQ